MLRTIQIALFSAAALTAACSKSDKPAAAAPEGAKPELQAPVAAAAAPAAPANGNTELQNKGIAMIREMGDMFAADAKDCEKLATDIKAFIAKNKDLIGQIAAMEKQQSEQERASFEERNKGVQEELMKKMAPTMQTCGANANVQAAMATFPSE